MATTVVEIDFKNPGVFDLPMPSAWAVITCDSWAVNGELAVQTLLSADIMELQFFGLFMQESTVLRQHPRFREMVVESGLIDYWRRWGWPDYCEPVGEDDFRCDWIRTVSLQTAAKKTRAG